MKTFVWQKEVVIYQRVAAEDRREAYGKQKRHYRNIEKKLIDGGAEIDVQSDWEVNEEEDE